MPSSMRAARSTASRSLNFGVFTGDSQAHEDRPPVVDQGDDPPHDLAALPVLGRETCPSPLILQLVEVVLHIAPVPVMLRNHNDGVLNLLLGQRGLTEIAPTLARRLKVELDLLEHFFRPLRRIPVGVFEIVLESGENAFGSNMCCEAWLGTAQRIEDRSKRGQSRVIPRNIKKIAKRTAQAQIRFREPDGMEMRAHQIFVGKVESRWGDLPANHTIRSLEEILVVWAACRAVREDQRRLTAATRSAAALGVVGRGRWNVPHVDYVQLGNVHAKLDIRGAIENRQFRFPEPVFADKTILVRNLRGVLSSLKARQIGRASCRERA